MEKGWIKFSISLLELGGNSVQNGNVQVFFQINSNYVFSIYLVIKQEKHMQIVRLIIHRDHQWRRRMGQMQCGFWHWFSRVQPSLAQSSPVISALQSKPWLNSLDLNSESLVWMMKCLAWIAFTSIRAANRNVNRNFIGSQKQETLNRNTYNKCIAPTAHYSANCDFSQCSWARIIWLSTSLKNAYYLHFERSSKAGKKSFLEQILIE